MGFNDPQAQNQSPFASFSIFRYKNFTGYTLRSLLYDLIIFHRVKLEFNTIKKME